MAEVVNVIRRLSPNQLRALYFLAKSEKGIVASFQSKKTVGKEGKGLGAIFSSLSRRKINNQSLIIPWGKDASGRGLRWRLNEKLIAKKELLLIVRELLA